MIEREVHAPKVMLDRSSPIPLYHQISTAIEKQIRSGHLVPGTRIENEVAMAHRLGVSRPTTRQALEDLVEHGLVIRKRGVGTQVAPELIRRPVELTSLYDDLTAAGRHPRTEVLSMEVVQADHATAERLGIDQGQDVMRIRRLRFADDEPLAILVNHMRPEVAPTAEQLTSSGLYVSLREAGVQVRLARQTIGARLATAQESRLLTETPRAAVLTMERVAFDDANQVVEVGSHIYRASRYTFTTTLSLR